MWEPKIGATGLGASATARRALSSAVLGVVALGVIVLIASGAPAETANRSPPSCPDGAASHEEREHGRVTQQWCSRRNGVRHGRYASYYDNGKEIVTGEYRDGVMHGNWAYFLSDGSVWRRDEYRDGGLVSKWLNSKTMDAGTDQAECGGTVVCMAGDKREVCRFRPQRPETTTVRYPDGRRAEGAYVEGVRSGKWRFWYANGELARELTYDNGAFSAGSQDWYKNGRPKSSGTYFSGEKVGTWVYWDRDGKKRCCHRQGDQPDHGLGSTGTGMARRGRSKREGKRQPPCRNDPNDRRRGDPAARVVPVTY